MAPVAADPVTDLGRRLEAQVGHALRRRRARRLGLGGTGVALAGVAALGVRSTPDRASAPTAVTTTNVAELDRPSPSDAGAPATPAASSTSTSTSTTRPSPPPLGVTPDPSSLLVLVDPRRGLPEGWEPADLVEPSVPFTFSGSDPKRLLRPEAAAALEGLFRAAIDAGHPLAAVSGYRSAVTQTNVFSATANAKGEAEAARVSARPGHSEHQTGLAVDVTGADGACPASACFAGTTEAAWLAVHAARFGYIVRYPAGAEAVTGYEHEPWHLRFVGPGPAAEIARRHTTLEAFLGVAGTPP